MKHLPPLPCDGGPAWLVTRCEKFGNHAVVPNTERFREGLAVRLTQGRVRLLHACETTNEAWAWIDARRAVKPPSEPLLSPQQQGVLFGEDE